MPPRPPSGVGVSLRREHYDAILATSRRVDWLEIQPENFMGKGGRTRHVLDTVAERWPMAAHGVALSLGGPDPFPSDYLEPLEALLRHIDAPWFSEHLSYASAAGQVFHDLLPLPFSAAAIDHVSDRIRQLRARVEAEVLVENISYYATMPGSDRTEGAFVTQVVEQAEAGLLLDVNNVYVNAKNHGLDPEEALRSLPLQATRQIHLAGHRRHGDVLIDDHGSAVCDDVWALFEQALAITGRVPVLIEWENRVPSLDRVLDEADRARAILDRVAPAVSCEEVG